MSTEDEEILKVAEEYGAKAIERPPELADNLTFKQYAIIHAVKNLTYRPDYVISIQASSPEMSAVDLDKAIEKIIEHDRSEIFSVNPELIQNAAFRVMKYDYVFQETISTRSGVYVTDYVDVHSIEDVIHLEASRRPSGHYDNT